MQSGEQAVAEQQMRKRMRHATDGSASTAETHRQRLRHDGGSRKATHPPVSAQDSAEESDASIGGTAEGGVVLSATLAPWHEIPVSQPALIFSTTDSHHKRCGRADEKRRRGERRGSEADKNDGPDSLLMRVVMPEHQQALSIKVTQHNHGMTRTGENRYATEEQRLGGYNRRGALLKGSSSPIINESLRYEEPCSCLPRPPDAFLLV
jgi:hypothetical protein